MSSNGSNQLNNIYHFDTEDYVVFFLVLVLSALTGLYYGCNGKYCSSRTEQTFKEYLRGNKNFTPILVALSLMGSDISGIMMIGMPSEVYHYGIQFWLIVVPSIISGFIIACIFVPVFVRLQVCSSYEYLELRFNKSIRTTVSTIYVLIKIMFLPICVYASSLAFNQVTGMNIHLIGSIVCLVCVFYTLLGGFKAVIRSDSWQIGVIFFSTIVVVISGTIVMGGTGPIADVLNQGGLFTYFSFSPNMYEKYTVWSLTIGATIHWSSNNAVSQQTVQKYMSLPTEKQSKLSIIIFGIGQAVYMCLCCYAGLLMYTTYHNCDPRSLGRIKADDQIFPLYVMESIGHIKLIPGLFIAGIFCGALSTFSVVLNATAQVIYEDFIKSCMKLSLTERKAMIVVKGIVLLLGICSVGLLFVVEYMGAIVQLTVSIYAITGGTVCGIFTLGMLIPWSNTPGAIFGGIAGFITASLITFGGNFAKAAKLVGLQKLPVFFNDSCFDKYHISRNISIPVSESIPNESSVFPLFRLSHLWTTTISISVVLIVGTVVSFLTGKTNLKRLDPDLISPVAHWVLPEEAKRHTGYTRRRVIPRDLQESEKIMAPMDELDRQHYLL